MGSTSESSVAFGREMKKYFLLDREFRHLNHGSYGTFPIPILEKYRALQEEQERSPDTFIRISQPAYLLESRSQIANFLNVPRQTVVYVKNATVGVNTVLRNLVYQPGDVVVYFSHIYNAVEKTVAYLAETTPLRARRIEYEFPINHEQMVEKFVETVRQAKAEEGVNVKLAIFDTIVSNPGIRMPFERLTEVCREEGVLSCIDGAHGIGHIPLDLEGLDPDFFVSNCHKWLFNPRGTSVFYVPIRNQHLMRSSLPTSHGFEPIPGILTASTTNPPPPPKQLQQRPANNQAQSTFELGFEFVGTTDDVPYLCIPAALEFRQKVCGGEDKIMEYCETLAYDAGNLVAEMLGTEVLCEAESKPGQDDGGGGAGGVVSQFRRCALVNVRLPIAVNDGTVRAGDSDRGSCPVIELEDAGAFCLRMGVEMTTKYKTFVPSFRLGGWLWVRLSAQVYLDLEDFRWLGTVLKELSERVAAGELN